MDIANQPLQTTRPCYGRGVYWLAEKMKHGWCVAMMFVALTGVAAEESKSVPVAVAAPPAALVWDSELKEYFAKTNEETAKLTFTVTNVAAKAITIKDVQPSCGCTVAELPANPWVLAPKDHGSLSVEVDLRNRSGLLQKTLLVEHTEGYQTLTFKVHIPEATASAMPGGDDRARNQKLALLDRQVILRNNCAKCHVAPAKDKKGEELYTAACGICHDAEHRASMVPDLRKFKPVATKDYWKLWISYGKPGTLMPGFAASAGGFLTPEQVDSLIAYLMDSKSLPVGKTNPVFPKETP